MSVNKAILIGHLGADPELRRTTAGKPIATFNLATTETWRDKTTGEKKQATEWHRVVVFNEGLAGIAEKYLKKGSKVYLEAQIKTRKWQGNDGQDRYSTEIVLQNFDAKMELLDRSQGSGYQPGGNGPEDYGQQSTRQPAPTQGNFSRDIDDDIPF